MHPTVTGAIARDQALKKKAELKTRIEEFANQLLAQKAQTLTTLATTPGKETQEVEKLANQINTLLTLEVRAQGLLRGTIASPSQIEEGVKFLWKDYPNLSKFISSITASALEQFSNPCHEQDTGRFCETHGGIHEGDSVRKESFMEQVARRAVEKGRLTSQEGETPMETVTRTAAEKKAAEQIEPEKEKGFFGKLFKATGSAIVEGGKEIIQQQRTANEQTRERQQKRLDKVQNKYGVKYPWRPVGNTDKNEYGHTEQELDREGESLALQVRSFSAFGRSRSAFVQVEAEARAQALVQGRVATKGEISIAKKALSRKQGQQLFGLITLGLILKD